MASAPIRILYILDALHGPDRGGTEGQLCALVGALDRTRFEPHVSVFRPTPFTAAGGVLTAPLTVLGIHRLLHLGTLMTLIRLSRSIRRAGVQVVHVFLNDASLVAPLFCRLGGARVIVSRRDMGFWYTPLLLRLLRISNWFVSRMVVNSAAVRDNVHKFEHFPVRSTDVLPNGLDLTACDVSPLSGFREQRGIGPDDPVIGMVAHFHPWKRQDDLLEAFRLVRLRHPRAHLVFVGSGPCESSLHERCDPALKPFVHFTGALKQVAPVLKHFTIGVLCSDSEGLSNALMEYLACGLPVVCTSVGGNPELVTEGVTGFLVPAGDPAALADRIHVLLSDTARAQDMGLRARQSAEGFSLGTMVERQMSIYATLVGQAKAAC
jgi:glycosyltransferase involved in cell wall biosynthesis